MSTDSADAVSVRKGATVEHPDHGVGTVRSITAGTVYVDFDDSEESRGVGFDALDPAGRDDRDDDDREASNDDDLRALVEDIVAEETRELRARVDDAEERAERAEQRADELEAERDELAERVEELESNAVMRTAMNHLAEALTGAEIDDYSDDIFQNREAFAEFRGLVEDLGEQVEDNAEFIDEWGEGETTDNDEAWFQAVQAAQNLRGRTEHTTEDGNVVLYADNLDTVLSYCYRYCVDLIETWGDEKRGATWRPHKPASAGENNEERRKRLIVDMDVWGEDE